MKNFFETNASQRYDERNLALAPIMENLHFLTGMMLQDLPADARILSVGVGTGAEILALSRAYPGWTFVGVDPSAAMLDVCRERLTEAGIMDRCELLEGYVQDVPSGERFDAALALLVGHFVPKDEQRAFYEAMHERLKPGGYLVAAHISFDLDSEAFPSMLANWERVQTLMGATKESLEKLPRMLRDVLTILPSAETETTMRASGFPLPIRFFQAFMISGWFARKGDSE